MDTVQINPERFSIVVQNNGGTPVLSLEFQKDRGLVVYNAGGLAVFSVGVEGSMRGNHLIAQGNVYQGENTEAMNLRIGEAGFHARSFDGNSNVKVLGQQSAPINDATDMSDVVSVLNALLSAAREQGWIAIPPPSPGE